MKTVIFETGATDEQVNNLILFTDNTRELAELRNSIYEKRLKNNMGKKMNFASISPLEFKPLFFAAREKYRQEIRPYSVWVKVWNMTTSQIAQYCRLYAADFKNWKKENNK